MRRDSPASDPDSTLACFSDSQPMHAFADVLMHSLEISNTLEQGRSRSSILRLAGFGVDACSSLGYSANGRKVADNK